MSGPPSDPAPAKTATPPTPWRPSHVAQPAGASPGVRVLGAKTERLRDVYHAFLRMPWASALGLVVAGYLGLNALFALAYVLVGGVSGARPGSLTDAYAFSIQTMGTIGYGAMFPQSTGAHGIVIIESVTGLLVTALVTGLVFAKFSRTTSRIVFTQYASIAPMDGVPTLSFRVGNERSNTIMEAQVRVSMVRTVRTKEGQTFYRLSDLVLNRDRSPAMQRSWTVMHTIDEKSPLFGKTPDGLKAEEIEFMVSVVGVDDTSLQPVHARRTYLDHEVIWGARPADVLSEEPDGSMVLDVGKFHDMVATERTEGFPYP